MPEKIDLVIAFSGGLIGKKRIMKLSGKCPFRWVYLGNDCLRQKRLSDALGADAQILDIGRQLRETAKAIKAEYVRWHDDLGRANGKGLDWWFGVVSSRNYRKSCIFHYCCFLEVLQQLWEDPGRRPAMVVVESGALAESVKKWAASKKISFEVLGRPEVKFQICARGAHAFLCWGKFWIAQLCRALAAFATRLLYRRSAILNDQDYLIVTMVHGHSVSKSGNFNDVYFPFLYEFLKKHGCKKVLYPFFYGFKYNYFPVYSRLRKSQTFFLIPEDFLGFLDYYEAAIYSLRVLLRKMNVKQFRGFDISSAVWQEQMTGDTVLGLGPVLTYRFFPALKRKGGMIKNALLWYENSAIDRAVVTGLRKAFPGVKIMGAQPFLHPPLFLSPIPSDFEVDAGISPDILLGVSDYECGIARGFSEKVACRSAAALRYQHLFKDDEVLVHKRNDNFKRILVLLPYDIGEAVEILGVVSESLPAISKEIRFLVKVHPDYTFEQLKEEYSHPLPDRFDAFDGNLKQGLLQADMVISGMSSAMVEAAIHGLPVIFIGGQTSLEENYMACLDLEMTANCFSARELVETIRRYYCLSPEKRDDYRNMGKKLRDLYFLPVNETTLQPYLG